MLDNARFDYNLSLSLKFTHSKSELFCCEGCEVYRLQR